MPAITRTFGILPQHLDDMTWDEINAYMDAAREMENNARRQRQAMKAKKRR